MVAIMNACLTWSILRFALCPQLSPHRRRNLLPHPLKFATIGPAQEVEALFALPFNDLLFQAQTVHRQYFDPNQVQVSTLLSIKTGACPEDCAYCPQSTRYDTGLEVEKLMEVEKVLEQARAAVASGATRFCMGAAWRCPKPVTCPTWSPWSRVCVSWVWRAA